MATHTARCCYFLWSRSGQNTTLQQLKQRSRLKSLHNNTLQLSVAYGTRRTDSTQESFQDPQVDIPVDRLSVSYSRSSGPGGQHVNKVSTKAFVRFHVLTADWIPEDVRQKIFEKNKTRINKAGELLVTSELSRSQQRNLSDCVQKIANIIADASVKPYEPTEEELALREKRLEKSNKERLKKKRIHSELKKGRRVDFD